MKLKTGTVAQIAAGWFCPSCEKNGVRSPMVSKVGGLRCGVEGNKWIQKLNDGKGAWTKCGFGVWLEKSNEDNKFVVRPNKFPAIATPTMQQEAIRRWFGMDPRVRGSRCLVVNAGPGTGKTTTISWSLEAAWDRLGTLDGYHICAFNLNAKDVLLSKLPWQVPCIATLNGLGGRLQGYRGNQYDKDKLRGLFEELQADVADEEKESFGEIGTVIERMRALCLYNGNPHETTWWDEAIDVVISRFGMEPTPEELLLWRKWVPVLSRMAQRRDKVIDLCEQYARPVVTAIAKTGFKLPWVCAESNHEWTDDEVRAFADLIREIQVSQCRGLVIDEGQDMSLAMVATYLAAVYRNGELVVIGDDRAGEAEKMNLKVGQGIYGWRGAFPGSMKLIQRLWAVLTGSGASQLPLSITHRCAPEVVEAFSPLNMVLRSAVAPGKGKAFSTDADTAFGIWAGMPAGKRGLWITRTNRSAARALLRTIKHRIPCGFRGGYNFEGVLHHVFGKIGGEYDRRTGEYTNSLEEAERLLVEEIDKCEEEREDPERMEYFVLEVLREVKADAGVLLQVEGLIHYEATLGNVRRFLMAYNDKEADRMVSNVYRCKGDEADWVVVSDDKAMNAAWGNDMFESDAVRHVAMSRAKTLLCVVGYIAGFQGEPLAKDDTLRELVPGEFRLKAPKVEKKPAKRRAAKKKATPKKEEVIK